MEAPAIRSVQLSSGPCNRGFRAKRLLPADQRISRQCMPLRDLVGFTLPSPTNHTMAYALLDYCLNRLPVPYLTQLQQQNIPLEIHAIPCEALEKHHDLFGFDWVERLVWRLHDLNKPYNFRRPELLLARESATGKRVALLTIMPGKDYVRHYAAIVGVALRAHAPTLDSTDTRCVLYPQMTQSIMTWTGLTELSSIVQPGDVVILGFVAELLALFQAIIHSLKIISRHKSAYYELTRLEIPGGVTFSLLGVNYSYWGNLGGIVMGQLALRQPRAVCYVAKQATLVTPGDIHQTIFSPTRYCIFDKGESLWFSDDHPATPINPLSSKCPSFDRGLHVSTPTIIEQDVNLRAKLDVHGVASMDNELAQMARALTDLHEKNPSMPRVPLLPLMFITDYIRREDEMGMKVAFDLTSRDHLVDGGKQTFFLKSAHLILETFGVIERPRAVIAGTGYGVKTILPALQRRGVEVVGLCGGRNLGKTESIARQHQIPLVDCSLSEMQAKHQANLLFVASPHDKHASLVREALDIGNFDIVCEKPLALDLPTMDRFIDRTRNSSRLALINHPLRFYPPFRYLKAIVRSPENLQSIDVQYLTKRLAKHTMWHECFSKQSGGGMLLAMATHFIDLIEWLTNSPLSTKSLETLTTQNNIGALPVEGKEGTQTPDVESSFQMSGSCGLPINYSIHCDGSSNTELFTVTLRTHKRIEYQFVQQKGRPIVVQQRNLPCREWMPLPLKMTERMWTGSPWQISFQCFAEKLVESICMNDRTRFSQEATHFAGYKRQIEVFSETSGLF